MYVHSLYEVAATGTARTVQTALYSVTAALCHPLCSNEEQRLVDCKEEEKKSEHAGAQTCAREANTGLVRISH